MWGWGSGFSLPQNSFREHEPHGWAADEEAVRARGPTHGVPQHQSILRFTCSAYTHTQLDVKGWPAGAQTQGPINLRTHYYSTLPPPGCVKPPVGDGASGGMTATT